MHSPRLSRTGIAGLIATFATPALADLNDVPNLTPVQAPVASTVQTICPTLAGSTGETQKLFVSCRALVQTSNAQQGSGATAFDMGLTESQLAEALQGIAPEEAGIQARSQINTPGLGALQSRLFELHAGASGFQLSALDIYTPNRTITAEQLFGKASTGGAASTDGTGSRWGGFLNAAYFFGDKDTTDLENGFDFDSWTITGGVDYRLRENLVIGTALTYATTKADISQSLGDSDSDSYSLSLYGTYYRDNFYVDAHASYSMIDFETARRIFVPSFTAVPSISTTAEGDTDGDQFTFVLGAGYDVNRGAFTFTPYGRVSYLNLDIDSYTESEPLAGLALDVNSQSVKSLQTALGIRLAYAMSRSFGALVPQVSAEWNHEFKNDDRNITAKYTNDPNNSFFAIPTADPDRNFFTVSAGVSAVFQKGASAFVNVQTVIGLEDVNSTGVSAGVRMEF